MAHLIYYAIMGLLNGLSQSNLIAGRREVVRGVLPVGGVFRAVRRHHLQLPRRHRPHLEVQQRPPPPVRQCRQGIPRPANKVREAVRNLAYFVVNPPTLPVRSQPILT